MWEPPRQSRRHIWTTIAVLAIGSGIGVFIFLRGWAGTGTQAAVSTGVAAIAGTPQATATEGIETEVTRSITPAGTAPPTTAPGALYVATANGALTAWETGAIELAKQGELFQGDMSLLNDPTWKANVTGAVRLLEQAAQDLRALPPAPEGYENVDQAMARLANASDILTADVDAVLGGNLAAALQLQEDFNQTFAAYEAVQAVLLAASSN